MATIALVDDDPDVLALVGTMLESEGYRVVAYSGGAAALNGFKTVQVWLLSEKAEIAPTSVPFTLPPTA